MGWLEQTEKLRRGEPGRYQFTLPEGESYEHFKALIEQSGAYALKYGGTCHVVPGTMETPETLIVDLPSPQ
ncbi:hypothetical protein [Asticcacaulis sp. EMRT-3]|uniref:hypothetical protein n=1 Tax=Asticcacaulis sp. EMRT-3 TaxID=3040349 RepID=UPI0024AF25D5|nr:hypothetical protein [Asticcacaulis sp. EMRT-3]MDI7774370.1 hypothetical protein [Asticcacaulis sp. EMRT-3]